MADGLDFLRLSTIGGFGFGIPSNAFGCSYKLGLVFTKKRFGFGDVSERFGFGKGVDGFGLCIFQGSACDPGIERRAPAPKLSLPFSGLKRVARRQADPKRIARTPIGGIQRRCRPPLIALRG
jgi:hypothetical protein